MFIYDFRLLKTSRRAIPALCPFVGFAAVALAAASISGCGDEGSPPAGNPAPQSAFVQGYRVWNENRMSWRRAVVMPSHDPGA